MKTVITEDNSFQILVSGVVIGTGTVDIMSTPSEKMKIENKKVYTSPMNITIKDYVDTNIKQSSVPVIANIIGSSQKIKLNNQALVLDGDSVDVIISGIHPITGVPVPSYGITVKVVAKETKVEVN